MKKVLIVDDSKFMRNLLKNIINALPSFEVAGEAQNGEEALEMIQRHPYDVVTMDIEMPKMNGIQTLRELAKLPQQIPVVMFSSLTKEGARETVEALSIGASSFLTKPNNPIELNRMKETIEQKLMEAVSTKKTNRPFISKRVTGISFEKTDALKNVVLLGCSTGGPKSLRNLIPQIPKEVPAAFVIVQHMPAGNYIHSLAEGLNRVSEVTVKEAEHNEMLKNGHVYIIPGGKHGRVEHNFTISLNENASINGHRPSVDVLFQSGASLIGKTNVTGIVLTGMGSDGAKGALELKSKGCPILAESEETAIVYGMPKKVFEAGAASEVLPLEDVVPVWIKKYMK